MIAELHMIQNFAPANLNRDDTGAPKDAEFGGYRRARISSQCLKRAIRTAMREQGLAAPEDLAVRTKRVRQALLDRTTPGEADRVKVGAVIDAALAAMGFPSGDDGKSEYLLFLGDREVTGLAKLCEVHWQALEQAAGLAGEAKSGKKGKKAAKEALAKDVQDAFVAVLNGGKARDLALFGRMVADLPGTRVDAACQMAHALSTHQVNMEFDYYTAVDDLQPDDATGADMIGDVQFNSACFYRYSNVDVRQLAKNLGDDNEAAVDTVSAFLRASIDAIPTGKQHSMAALNLPSLILAVVRRHGASSLTNAFVHPVRPTREANLIVSSIRELDTYWAKLAAMYGTDAVVAGWTCTTEPQAIASLSSAPLSVSPSVAGLIQSVGDALRGR